MNRKQRSKNNYYQNQYPTLTRKFEGFEEIDVFKKLALDMWKTYGRAMLEGIVG